MCVRHYQYRLVTTKTWSFQPLYGDWDKYLQVYVCAKKTQLEPYVATLLPIYQYVALHYWIDKIYDIYKYSTNLC